MRTDEIRLNIFACIGKRSLSLKQIKSLEDGVVIELDKLAGEPVDIYVNDTISEENIE